MYNRLNPASAGTIRPSREHFFTAFNPSWAKRRMWFPRELSWGKKAPKENTKLWFPLMLGILLPHSGMAGNKPSMRTSSRKPQRRCCRGQNPQVQALLSDNFQRELDTQTQNSRAIEPGKETTDFLSVCISASLPLPPRVKETSFQSLRRCTASRPWTRLRRSDS